MYLPVQVRLHPITDSYSAQPHSATVRGPQADLHPTGSEPCYFAELPAELKNTIYQTILVDRYEIQIKVEEAWNSAKQPPLTRVSRQIRSETLPIFYGSNRFSFEVSAANEIPRNCSLGPTGYHFDQLFGTSKSSSGDDHATLL